MWGLIKYYHIWLDPKLIHAIWPILHDPCDCVVCTTIVYKLCFSGEPHRSQSCYHSVTNCIYWPFLVTNKNCSIIFYQQGYIYRIIWWYLQVFNCWRQGKYVNISKPIYLILVNILSSFIQLNDIIGRQHLHMVSF